MLNNLKLLKQFRYLHRRYAHSRSFASPKAWPCSRPSQTSESHRKERSRAIWLSRNGLEMSVLLDRRARERERELTREYWKIVKRLAQIWIRISDVCKRLAFNSKVFEIGNWSVIDASRLMDRPTWRSQGVWVGQRFACIFNNASCQCA